MLRDPSVCRPPFTFFIPNALGRLSRAVVLGHSFNGRVDDYMHVEFVRCGQQPDIATGCLRTGVLTADMLWVNCSYYEVDFRHSPFARGTQGMRFQMDY